MTRFMLSVFAAILIAISVWTPIAAADVRSVYTIRNVEVDVEANTAREAEAKAFLEAKQLALVEMVERITLPEDRQKLSPEMFSEASANELAAAVDVVSEKRSARAYRGTLSVVFNPIRLRARLDGADVPYVDTQAALSLVAPVSADPLVLDAWRAAWPAANQGALNPYITGLAYYTPSDGWASYADEVRGINAQNVVRADLTGSQGAYRVRLVRISPDATTTIGITGNAQTVEQAARVASAYLDAAWKRQSVIRSSSRTDSYATARFESLSQWVALRSALNNSPLVSEFQVNALSREGALVSFQYAGSDDRLTQELRQRGVRAQRDGNGWLMRSSR